MEITMLRRSFRTNNVSSMYSRSSVSPLSSIVLERQDTYTVKMYSTQAQNAVNAAESDSMLHLAGDTRATFWNSFKSIVGLAAQLKVLLVALYHLAICLLVGYEIMPRITFGYVDILGWTVGLLVAFRQREGMLRWWEGRSAWGQLVNRSRDLVRSVVSYNVDKDSSIAFCSYVCAFPIVLKNFLRGNSEFDEKELEHVLSEHDLCYILQEVHLDRALSILDLLNGACVNMLNNNTITQDTILLSIDPTIRLLSEHLGSIIRIKTTPIPDTYRVVLNLVIWAFLVSMPFSLLGNNWNPAAVFLVSSLVSVVLQTLVELAEAIEDPFGNDILDLPLGKYTADIVQSCIHITDRFYRPRSILLQSKVEQKRQHDFKNKMRRARLKTNVITRFARASSDGSAEDYPVSAEGSKPNPLMRRTSSADCLIPATISEGNAP